MDVLPFLEEDPLGPTTRLLLECLKLNGGNELEDALGRVALSAWQAVLLRAGELGVGPLLYQRLSIPGTAKHLPEGIFVRVEAVYQEGVVNNLRAFQSLDRVLAALAQQHIPVIPLKGAYLVEKIYKRIGLRSMGDIDLLVEKDRLEATVQVLKELGFHASFPFEVEREIQEMHALPALDDGRGLTVDLHWTLASPTGPLQIPIERVWGSAAPGHLRGFEVMEMCAEDLLLHLCIHAAYLDGFSSGLRPICDIAWVIQADQELLDWAALVAKARQWGIGRSVWLALMTTERLLHPMLPGGALDELQPAAEDLPLLNWAIAQVLWPPGMSRKLAVVWAPNTWYNRTKLVGRFLFPTRRELRPFFPRLGRGPFWMVAYAIHLVRVLRRNWGSASKLLGADPQARAAALQSERANRLLDWQGKSEKISQDP